MSVQATKKMTKAQLITILSSVGKTMEKLVHKHVHNYLLANRIITSFQSGLTAGDSSLNQVVELYFTWTNAKMLVLFSVT